MWLKVKQALNRLQLFLLPAANFVYWVKKKLNTKTDVTLTTRAYWCALINATLMLLNVRTN